MPDPDVGPFGELSHKLKKYLEKVRSYIETERAIRAGEDLWNQSPEDLAKRKLLGPWAFTATGTLYAGVVVNLFEKGASAFLKEPWPMTMFNSLKKKPFFETWFAINDYTIWFFFALQTTFLVAITSRGVLWSEDSTRDARRRLSSAFLYLDGAKNTHKQVVAGILFVGYSFFSATNHPLVPWLAYVGAFLIIWALYTVLISTTKSLFQINGYSCRFRFFWQKPRVNDPPWIKFIIINLAAPVISIAVAVIYVGLLTICSVFYYWLKTVAFPK